MLVNVWVLKCLVTKDTPKVASKSYSPSLFLPALLVHGSEVAKEKGHYN
jgi:hypothetical protein